MKVNKSKQILFTIFGILGLIVIMIGTTYAVFTYTKLGTTDNIVTTGTLKFLYTENSAGGTGINISEAEPISDTRGKELVGDNNIFDFKVEGTNTGSEVIPYEVTLRKKDTSTMSEENVKVYLTDETETTDIVEPTLYSKLVQTNIDVGSNIEKTLYKGEVTGNTNNYLKTFRLRMWIDENSNQNDINGKSFTGMVNVYSNAKVISEEEKQLRSNAEIDSISIGDNTLTKVENQDYNYSIKLTDRDINKTIKVVPTNSLSSVEIKKDNNISSIVNGGEINPTVGDNIYKVTVTSADKSNTTESKVLVKVIKTEKVKIFNQDYYALDTTPTLTTSSNNTDDLNGLYSSTATNTGEPTYYFRGAVENNYVSFAGFTWRIVRINEDGTIRIVMQDGINDNTKYQFNPSYNSYAYMYYTNSQAKTTLEDWYNNNIGNKEDYSKYVATGPYYCEQAKTKITSNWGSGNATMIPYSSYTPNFKCTTDGNGKGIINSNVGLLTYDEVVFAGGYYTKNNSDYYLYNSNIHWWTTSPAGFSSGSCPVWTIPIDGNIDNNSVHATLILRATLNIKPDVKILNGDGTKDNPFVIK